MAGQAGGNGGEEEGSSWGSSCCSPPALKVSTLHIPSLLASQGSTIWGTLRYNDSLAPDLKKMH